MRTFNKTTLFLILTFIISFSSAGIYKLFGGTGPGNIGFTILGAVNIFILLNREFFILLGISLLVAWPGVWYVYNAIPGVHKLPMSPIFLLLSALVILSITIVTSVYQTWRAATRNPIEALRNE